MVQWLSLHVSKVGGCRFDPWSVTKIFQHSQKEKVFNMEHLLMAKKFELSENT